MANPQAQQKPSQSANQSSQSQSKPDANKSWDKDASARSQGSQQGGMKNEPTLQNRDQFRSDASKK